MRLSPLAIADAYKESHSDQYPPGITYVYSNFTPRASRDPLQKEFVLFGLQAFLLKMERRFDKDFFGLSEECAVKEFNQFYKRFFGKDNPALTERVRALRKLDYLPLKICALPEGSVVPHGVPVLTIENTHPEFFWLTNFIETWMSSELWHPCTSATTAREYRNMFDAYAEGTSDMKDFPAFQGHDFSMRGLPGIEAAMASGAAHLLSFSGTDTCPALSYIDEYYGGDPEGTFFGTSVPATEHSVMCAGQQDGELETYRRLLTEVYPEGIVSVVSDTWDLWQVVGEILPSLKDVIMARNGTLVIRPDSGDPVKILVGDPDAPIGSPVHKGLVRCLMDIFGGVKNSKGYYQLDPHIGAIYGDSITLDRQAKILGGLKAKGLASTNVVLGIGSYCVKYDTPVLCSDLVWRKAEDLEAGQEIIAFDENPTFDNNRRVARTYKTATIVSNNPAHKNCIRVFTDKGDPIIASEDHPLLVWAKNRTKATVFINGATGDNPRSAGLVWKTAKELEEGDEIAFLCKPWEREESREAGWLAGMFDGEGSLSKSTGDARIPAWKVNISQNNGPLLERVHEEMQKRGFTVYKVVRKCPQLTLTGGWAEFLRFMGTIAPYRLASKFPTILGRLPGLFRDKTYTLAKVTKVEKVGSERVASIQTSCGTFITAGYLSHNTYQYVTRDTHGIAVKATAIGTGWKGSGPEQIVSIFKDPATDASCKKSARGLLRVTKNQDGVYELEQDCPNCFGSLLETVYMGGIVRRCTFQEVRKTLWS